MIFVVEKLFTDHRARVEAWERAREKWQAKNEYYSRSDYEDRYPRPGHALKVAGKVAIVTIAVLAAVGLTIGLATGVDHKHKSDKPKTTSGQAVEYKAKVDDKVQVVYGTYKDSVGVIVKVGNDDAIIKLVHSTFTKEMCNASSGCSSGDGHNDGELLGIADLDNIVPYKEVK